MMMKLNLPTRILAGVALTWVLSIRGEAADSDQSHAILNRVLTNYVRDARVNYASLKAHSQDLNQYLEEVAAISRADFKQWPEKQQIAFLINVYNAYTFRLILDHYPVKSIKEIGGRWSNPWDQPVVHLFGQTLTLNAVEHKMLRKDYNEPRIHFALVCAAKGCPPLRGEAYVATRLDGQLDDQAKQFLADTQKNRVDASGRTVYLSPIFKWYGEDFAKKSGSVLAFVKSYWPVITPSNYENFKIRYTDYDWSLNEQSE
jgi:hypothetical protein